MFVLAEAAVSMKVETLMRCRAKVRAHESVVLAGCTLSMLACLPLA